MSIPRNCFLLFTVLVIFSAKGLTQVPSYVSTNGLQGWWPFSGNANDLSVNGNSGIPSNVTLAIDRFGNNNSCYAFDSIIDSIRIPLQQSNITQYTVSAWFKTTIGGPLVAGRGTNGESGITLNMHNASTGGEGKAHFIVDGPGISLGKQSDSTFDDGTWHHIVGVYNGTIGVIQPVQFEIYIDTILVAQSLETAGPDTAPVFNNTDILFGNHQIWPAGFFVGSLDDIGIWNRALTHAEIIQLYQPCIPATMPTVIGVDTICEGSSTALMVAGGNLNNSLVWQWTVDSCNGTLLSTGTSITISPTNSMIYYVYGEGGCEQNGPCELHSIIVDTLPIVTVSLPVDTICLDDASLLLTGASPAGGTWSGTGVSGAYFNPTIANVGPHTVYYTMTNGVCTGIDSSSIVVDVCTRSLDFTETNILVYPNPNNGEFVLWLGEVSTAEIMVYDSHGKCVLQRTVNSSAEKIRLNNPGLYALFVRYEHDGGYYRTSVLVE